MGLIAVAWREVGSFMSKLLLHGIGTFLHFLIMPVPTPRIMSSMASSSLVGVYSSFEFFPHYLGDTSAGKFSLDKTRCSTGVHHDFGLLFDENEGVNSS